MKFIYRFHANVERPLILSGQALQVGIIGKTSTLPKHGDIILNSMSQTRGEWNSLILSRADF